MDIRGKMHNPENENLVSKLYSICSNEPCLQLPEGSSLRAPVRSNKSGERLLDGSLAHEVISTILASRCEWYTLVTRVAKSLKNSKHSVLEVISFGLNDCVPMSPFFNEQLRVTKTEAYKLIAKAVESPNQAPHPLEYPAFSDNAIAIIGAACRFPGANNLEELWELLSNGVDRHSELPTERFDLYGSFRACQSGSNANDRRFFGNFINDIRRFDHSFFGMSSREALNLDPQQRILLELSYEALEDAGYLASHSRQAGDPVGCFIGASLVEYLDNTNAYGPTAYTSTGTIRAFLCGRLSYYYGWCGPSEVIDTACSSSLVAINRACKAIQSGECSMALSGGVNAITGINNFLDLGKAGFLSRTGQCKPFDEAADGYCRSDGAGLVVLKRLKQAVADGDRILSVIPGIATNQGGLSASIIAPCPTAQTSLYRSVLEQANLQPDHVTYVEAHGTGTQVGDPLEIESIRSVFGHPLRPSLLRVGSIKGNIGHCETAAGVAGLLKVIAMIQNQKIPPQANHQHLNPKIPPLEPSNIEIDRHLCAWDDPIHAALVNSYGAAGSNCALLCCQAPEQSKARAAHSASSKIALPIILSAASRKSLVANAGALATYFDRKSADLTISNIAFTLNERRRQQRYCFTTTATHVSSLARELESVQDASFECSQGLLPVVLVFSGQNASTISLDKDIYDNFPAFRYYIDRCDCILQSLGSEYKSLYPTIFQAAPVNDIVSLQCGIFAVQYASARCWIDAGLQVNVIIGHSLGELTALVISGVLALEDAIQLVATRADLIARRWNAEKGAMLAIHTEVENIHAIISYAQPRSGGPKLEIACYNSASSFVVAGTLAAVEAAEELLKTNVSFQHIRYHRLGTSHAFHSRLAEPILEELSDIAKTFRWRDPLIPLEVCSAEPLEFMQNYSVSKHAREPVYFASAIQRIESRLGPCLWFEAGIDSPIIPMVRKACRTPKAHHFQTVTTRLRHGAIDAISATILELWRIGARLSHWSFLTTQQEHKQVWLPPYCFETTPHWLEHIDRCVELRQSLIAQGASEKTESDLQPPLKLITKMEPADENQLHSKFYINTECVRFQEILAGHAVRQKPLCPASLYMECAVMAVQTLHEELEEANLLFEDLEFQAALGIHLQRRVTITLEVLEPKRSWNFIVESSTQTEPKSRNITHATGMVALASAPGLESLQSLVLDSMDRLDTTTDVDRLMSKRAYKHFARIVDYAPFLQGITSITLGEREASATIKLPDSQPDRQASTAWRLCDTIAIDAFIQVIGLCMNSSDGVSNSEILVASGIKRVIISSSCEMGGSVSWNVYAKYNFVGAAQAIGDVFICSSEGSLVALLSGCRFTRLLISKLDRLLDSSNSGMNLESNAQTVPKSSTTSNVAAGNEFTPASTSQTDTDYAGTSVSRDAEISALEELIADYTGVREISADTNFTEIGLDSLASVEMVEELLSKFGIKITANELASTTFNDLARLLEMKDSGKINIEGQASGGSLPVITPSNDSVSQGSNAQLFSSLKLRHVLANILGVEAKEIEEERTLTEIGVDSLCLVDLKDEIYHHFSFRLENDQPGLSHTVKALAQYLDGVNMKTSVRLPSGGVGQMSESQQFVYPRVSHDRIIFDNVFEALVQSDAAFEQLATNKMFLHYWSNISPIQNHLLLAYIYEGFQTLGLDLEKIPVGHIVPSIPHLPKYDKLTQRLWSILESHGIIVRQSQNIIRGSARLDFSKSSELFEIFKAKHPAYEHEANLMKLAGPRLAECLTGKLDPVQLLFGSPGSTKIMESFYGLSPMMSTLTEHLVTFLITLLEPIKTKHLSPVRILEVGAGTGATSARVVQALEAAGISFEYVFTDISTSLVAKARKKFKHYTSMDFTTLNLENEVTDKFRAQFDIIISANCVHATTNRKASCSRLREILKVDGFLVLSEVTQVMDWYDICFGLLDGWWLAENGTTYPLQSAEAWMSTFREAGFASASFSRGASPESYTQQLLVGCKTFSRMPTSTTPHSSRSQETKYQLDTMVYKEVDGVQVHADVYVPQAARGAPISVGKTRPHLSQEHV